MYQGTETTTTTTTPTTLEISIRTNAQRRQGCLRPDKVFMLANYHFARSVVDTTLTHVLLPATTVVGHDIRPRNAELHLVLQAKEDPEPKEDKVVMLLASGAVKRAITRKSAQTMETNAVVTRFEVTNTNLRTIQGRIKETPEGITKHRPVTKEQAKQLVGYTICVQKLLYRTTMLSTVHS
ncbi:hypothetical protein Tco_0762401 [Tanacetum coccineum]